MFLVGIISWWYGRGFKVQFGRFRDRIVGTASFFSIGQLFSTFFSPFRQISAGSTSGPLGAVVRGLFDKLISRVIGAIVRLFTILIGIVVIIVQTIYELIILIGWLVVPAFPVIGLVVMAIGWVPRWM